MLAYHWGPTFYLDLSTNYSVQKADGSGICMFWPVEMKQLQNISVDVNFMPPNTDFARLGLGRP